MQQSPCSAAPLSPAAFEAWNDCREAVLRHLDGLRGIDTHSHHLADAQFAGVNLKFLYDHSYCDWMDHYPADDRDVAEFLRRNCCNSYFYWLQTAVERLYGLPVTAETLPKLNAAIADAYRDGAHHLRILEENCRYDRVLLDNYAHPGHVDKRRQPLCAGAALQHVRRMQLRKPSRPQRQQPFDVPARRLRPGF